MQDRNMGGFDKNDREGGKGRGGKGGGLMVAFFESSSLPKKVTHQLNFIKVHKVANYRVRLFRRLCNLNTF